MKTQFCRLSPVVSVARAAALVAAFAVFTASAFAGVFDDAKFKLDLRGGDPNGNDFVDSGEVVNAINPAQTAVLGGGQGPSKITAAQYASGGYDSYGNLPYVTDISVVNPADGSTYTQTAYDMLFLICTARSVSRFGTTFFPASSCPRTGCLEVP